MAGKYGADTRYRDTETGGLAEQQRQLKIAQQFINDNFTMDASGRPVPKPGTLGQTMAAVVGAGGIQNVSKSPEVMSRFGLLAAPSSREANLAAGGANATAAAKPTFAGTNEQAQAMTLQQQAADQAKAVKVAEVRGTIAQSIANSKGQTPGQPSKRDLLNEAAAIKIGAGYAQTVPQNGLKLNEVQALQLSRAAQAANPNLNPQDAIDKFVRDNPGMIEDGGWFSGNTFNIPPTERAAPAARAPVADSFKGAPYQSLATDRPTKPWSYRDMEPETSESYTTDKFAATPEGYRVKIDGVDYIKKGEKLVSIMPPVGPIGNSTRTKEMFPDIDFSAGKSPFQAAPAAQAAPAQGGMPTKAQFEFMDAGDSVIINGVKYVKQGRQLVPVK
jgi:hypothetical protein